MNLNQLRYFVSVVEHGSFKRAAESLHISQPALSNSIRKLELHLGADLLERGPKGVVPTPYGYATLSFFNSAIKSVKRATDEIELMKKGSRGHINLGALSGLMGELAPEIVLATLHKAHPDLTFSVRFSYLHELLELLREGHVDFILATYWPEANITDDMTVCTFANMKLSIFCRPDHPLNRKTPVTQEDLASAQWIIPDSPGSRWLLESVFGESYLTTIKQPITSSYVPFIHSMMTKTDLLGIVPDYFVRDLVNNGRLVRLPYNVKQKNLRTGIIYYRDRLRTPAMHAFLKAATEVGMSHFA